MLGSGRRFELSIFVSPGGYILGEETALLECLEDKRGEPRNKPPFPGQKGLFGQPTLINNVETFSIVPAILARGLAAGNVTLVRDPNEAAEGAHVVNTDVWASMGQEQEQEEREKAFAGFTVTGALMKRATREAIFLHCLPAHRGEEVTTDVIDGPQSCVWDEAENRLHVQKAVMAALIGNEGL